MRNRSNRVNMASAEDTEITLGTGKMLALFFGLVALCAVFFGMGFSLGKSSVKSRQRPCGRCCDARRCAAHGGQIQQSSSAVRSYVLQSSGTERCRRSADS